MEIHKLGDQNLASSVPDHFLSSCPMGCEDGRHRFSVQYEKAMGLKSLPTSYSAWWHSSPAFPAETRLSRAGTENEPQLGFPGPKPGIKNTVKTGMVRAGKCSHVRLRETLNRWDPGEGVWIWNQLRGIPPDKLMRLFPGKINWKGRPSPRRQHLLTAAQIQRDREI